MQHKYVQAIILTHVGPLAYPLAWTLASHVGVRKETKRFLFGGRETEARRYQIQDLRLRLESFRVQNLNPVHHQPPTLSASHRIIQKVEIMGQETVCSCCQWPVAIGDFSTPLLCRGGSFHVPEGCIKDLTFQTQFCAQNLSLHRLKCFILIQQRPLERLDGTQHGFHPASAARLNQGRIRSSPGRNCADLQADFPSSTDGWWMLSLVRYT